MYYKIEKRGSRVYQEMKALREKELKIEDENEKAIKEKTGLEFGKFLGYQGQSGFTRCTRYLGFEFTEPEKVDPKIWKESKDYSGCFEPYKRTKAGREMADFLNELPTTYYTEVLGILNLKNGYRRFTIPKMFVENEIVLLVLDDNMTPKDPNIIEITSVEFDKLLKNE